MALSPEERRQRFQEAKRRREAEIMRGSAAKRDMSRGETEGRRRSSSELSWSLDGDRSSDGTSRSRLRSGTGRSSAPSPGRSSASGTRSSSRRRSSEAEIDISGERFLAERRAKERRLRAEQRRKRVRRQRIAAIVIAVIAVIVLIFAVWALRGIFAGRNDGASETGASQTMEGQSGGTDTEVQVPETESGPDERELTISEAERLAMMYDYDGAIELLSALPGAAEDSEIAALISGYEETKAGLVRQDINTITHVFFHSLIVDPENALDKERWGTQADGYNSVMTTISEFEKMLDEFYRDGFVLVGLHDMAHIETTADGEEVMVEGDIMLPEGKKPMVMSQDDVCYYEYMEGAGFADRILIGEDGKTTCHYVDEEGNEHYGEYDLVPILNRFVEEHPDFSYKGAKACLAFTGYNGILGYRTDETYDPNSDMYDPEKEANYNIEEDRQIAREVAEALKAEGYELASHSWGHRDMSQRSLEDVKKDADRWEKNVNQELLSGTCDIILYPFGSDVGDWHAYTHENQKFDYLWDLGFRYFCGVDSSQYWVQVGKDYLRQGRRNLDGYMMWMDLSGQRDKLSDLFDDVGAIFDPARPTPVTQ